MENLIEEIKEYGLETTINEHITNKHVKELIRALFTVAFDKSSDEDYENLTLQVIEEYKDRTSDDSDTVEYTIARNDNGFYEDLGHYKTLEDAKNHLADFTGNLEIWEDFRNEEGVYDSNLVYPETEIKKTRN